MSSAVVALGGWWSQDPCGDLRSDSSQAKGSWSDVRGLALSFGYDSIAEDAGHLHDQVAHTDNVDPDAVSISAGRPDWTTFPWGGHEDNWSRPVQELRCDLLGRALQTLGTRPDGSRRARMIVVDAFIAGWIDRDPSVAGVYADGSRSELQASMAQLESGPVGDQLVALVGEVARRYQPEAVSLTELFASSATFGEDDLASYQRFSGERDWPRTGAGEIDQGDLSIADWRSAVIAGVVARAREQANQADVALLMEVRVNWADPTAGRPFSGQDYSLLVDAADQLVSWDYFALPSASGDPTDVESAVRTREDRWPGRWVSSVGLWASGDGVATPEDMAVAVNGAFAGGSDVVWVSPASKLSPAHWEALATTDVPTG